MTLVEITAEDHGVAIDLAYAGPGNFTGKTIYRRHACYLHPDAEACLIRAVYLAARQGLKLLIYDAFRPAEAQWKLFDHFPDPDFVADPRRGSPHSRGVAVDLTLADRLGQPLDLGTHFDDFTPLSHHGADGISPQAERNRHLLAGIMLAAGWQLYRYEWWHYQLMPCNHYPLLSDNALPSPMM